MLLGGAAAALAFVWLCLPATHRVPMKVASRALCDKSFVAAEAWTLQQIRGAEVDIRLHVACVFVLHFIAELRFALHVGGCIPRASKIGAALDEMEQRLQGLLALDCGRWALELHQAREVGFLYVRCLRPLCWECDLLVSGDERARRAFVLYALCLSCYGAFVLGSACALPCLVRPAGARGQSTPRARSPPLLSGQ